jgi:hypothetical protein
MKMITLLSAACAVMLLGTLATADPQEAEESAPSMELLPEEGMASLTLRVPVDQATLERLGLGEAVTAAEISRMVTTLGMIGAVAGGEVIGHGMGFVCDSRPNECTCDNRDPLDCIDIWRECTGPLHPPGEPDRLCWPGESETCICQWK